MKSYLSKEQLENIKAHKYTPCCYTTLDNFLNNLIWVPVSNRLPKTVSPNMITISGVLGLATGCFMIYLYDNTLSEVLPNWVYFYLIAMIYFFQTMDAVDGKHARNTNRASPLGQLIDHGLDIFSYAFQICFVVAGQRIGGSWGLFFYQAFTYITYFSHTWEEYFSGIFSTQIDNVGVTEFQLIATLMILSIPLFGNDAPLKEIFGIPVNQLFVSLIVILGIKHVYVTISRALTNVPQKSQKDCLRFLLPLVFIVTGLFCAQLLEITKTNTIEMVVLHGLVFSLLTAEQIIATTSKSPYVFFHLESFIYAVVMFISIFTSLLFQGILISIFSIFMVIRYFSYIFSITFQIMAYLNIRF